MNNEDIIRIARECGLHLGGPPLESGLARFAALVAAAEREACAEVVDGFDTCDPKRIAAAIRARNNT